MPKTAFILIVIISVFSSCKVTENAIAGVYSLDRFPKTILKINSDNTFEYSKNNRNPYLHPFDHQDEYYIDTRGSWQATGKKTISLTSQNDTLMYPITSIEAQPPRDNTTSYFIFYDTHGDTVKILYVQYSDSSISAALHRSMDYFTEDLTRRDTLEFHFYGYRPYTFISGQKTNNDYSITLKPAFQPAFFRATTFRIKRKRLIDIKRKTSFRLARRQEL
ncbi:MAG: hypothetical protein KA821_07025 [Chitinophagaceae bacterium]|nr:hypothetical protein [Chitinophagaceae bacterium]